MPSRVLLVGLAVIAFFPAYSQPLLVRRSVEAIRADSPPVIDGDLSDTVWETAPLLDNFVDYDTFEAADSETRVRLLYDDHMIYVAFECIKDSKSITATERKYDRSSVRSDDYFMVAFDTFLDGIQAYVFLVNPLGTRWDAREGVYGRNGSWDARWDAAVQVFPDRWVGELAIPIGTMFFRREAGQTWGVNFRRRDRVQGVGSHWNLTDTTGKIQQGGGQRFIADFGRWTGLDLEEARVLRRPELQAYVSATSTNPENAPTEIAYRSGLDLSLRLDQSWVGVFAINPDFGQVEADSGDIQNRDIERFLQERRPFFNEGAELFTTPLLVYNSRRITDISAAAKLTGTGPDWTGGALVLDGESQRSGDARFLVSRYTKQLGGTAQVGAILVGADRDNGYNWTGGLDVQAWMPRNITWTTQALGMRDRKRVRTQDGYGNEFEVTQHLSEYAWMTELEGNHRPFFWEFQYRDVSERFRPDLGFIPRVDVRGPSLELAYEREALRGAVTQYGAEFSHQFYENHEGITVLRDFSFRANVELYDKLDIYASRSEDFHKPYDNRRNSIFLGYNRQEPYKGVSGRFAWGTFQEFDFEEIDVSKAFRTGDRLTHDLDVTFRREHYSLFDRSVWIWRTEHEYTFPWQGRVKLTLEEASDNSYTRSVLLAYEDVKQWDFYFVFNDFRGRDQRILRGAFTKFVYRF